MYLEPEYYAFNEIPYEYSDHVVADFVSFATAFFINASLTASSLILTKSNPLRLRWVSIWFFSFLYVINIRLNALIYDFSIKLYLQMNRDILNELSLFIIFLKVACFCAAFCVFSLYMEIFLYIGGKVCTKLKKWAML